MTICSFGVIIGCEFFWGKLFEVVIAHDGYFVQCKDALGKMDIFETKLNAHLTLHA
jgi:hypothetical protein